MHGRDDIPRLEGARPSSDYADPDLSVGRRESATGLSGCLENKSGIRSVPVPPQVEQAIGDTPASCDELAGCER